jgi:hypothetical protein
VRKSAAAVDCFDGVAEFVGERVGGDDDVLSGLDLDRSVPAGGLDELADGPAGLMFDPAADCQCCEDDREVGFDGVPLAVVDGLGLQVAFGHPERFFRSGRAWRDFFYPGAPRLPGDLRACPRVCLDVPLHPVRPTRP